MLNHRLITALFAVSIGLVFLFCQLNSLCFYLSLAIILSLYLSVEFFGAYFIRLNFHLTSLNSLDENKPQIALTFDDGPCQPQTSNVLDSLKKHNVKATFFVIGKNIAGNEELIKRMINE